MTTLNSGIESLMEAARVDRLVTLRQFAADDWLVNSVDQELDPYRTMYRHEGAPLGESDNGMVRWLYQCADSSVLPTISMPVLIAETWGQRGVAHS
jgi:hypothetical protein